MNEPGRVEFHVYRSEPEILEAERLKRRYPTQNVAALFALDLAGLHEQAAAMNEVYGEDIGAIDTGKGRIGRLELIRVILEYRARFVARRWRANAGR